jgi:dethiobiotin synthetase
MSRRAHRVAGRGLFVAGTDTGVGKTFVSVLLLHAFNARGWRTAAMKPVAAGAQRRGAVWHNEDVDQLCAAASLRSPLATVNPYCFAPPIAPHIAADEADVRIALPRIRAAYRKLARTADVVVVEGAGGLLVPIDARRDTADIALALELPVVLVVGLRLGCINHALLTVAAMRSRGLKLAGWVANAILPRMARREQNIAALRARIPAPLLGVIPHARRPDPGLLCKRLDIDPLIPVVSEGKLN